MIFAEQNILQAARPTVQSLRHAKRMLCACCICPAGVEFCT